MIWGFLLLGVFFPLGGKAALAAEAGNEAAVLQQSFTSLL